MKHVRMIGILCILAEAVFCFTGCGSIAGKNAFREKVELLQGIDKDADGAYVLMSSDGEKLYLVGHTEKFGLFYGVSTAENGDFVCGNERVTLRREENSWSQATTQDADFQEKYATSLQEVRHSVQWLSDNAVKFGNYPRTWFEGSYPLYAYTNGTIYQVSLQDESADFAFLSMGDSSGYVLSWNAYDSWNNQPFILCLVYENINDSFFHATGLPSDMIPELSELLQSDSPS